MEIGRGGGGGGACSRFERREILEDVVKLGEGGNMVWNIEGWIGN